MSDGNGNSLANQVVINFWRDIIRTRKRKMLKNTFLHISGIGIKTEKRIWSSGIHSWDDLLGGDCSYFSHMRENAIKRCIEDSVEHLSKGNPNYFGNLLPSNQFWRFFPDFRESTAYLDIETTGLDSWSNTITTIALYDGKSVFTYVVVDLRKLKAHGLLQRDSHHYSYRLTEKGIKASFLFLLFHKRICGPLANSLFHYRPSLNGHPQSKLEAAYHKTDKAQQQTIDLLAA